MIASLRENVRLPKISTIDDANASRRMLVVPAAAGRTLTTIKGYLGIPVALAVLANVLSSASAFLPTTALSPQSGRTGILTPIDSRSFMVNSTSSSCVCLRVAYYLSALSVRKGKCLKPRIDAGNVTYSRQGLSGM